jgi:hypothetical protein
MRPTNYAQMWSPHYPLGALKSQVALALRHRPC